MSPDAMFNFNNGLILLLCGLFSLIVPFGWAQQRNNKPDEFSCPEEFGYYPHPTDCTQYYVCVFGGALVESCTGGLMYSHDLQTCDWPRNVGCVSSVSATASLNNANSVNTALGNEELGLRQTTPSWKHEALQPQQDEIPDRHLYDEEDLGPVEEIESDRQQRVYRGQPPTLGQVARDRDGIIRHVNALQTSAGPEKVKPVAVLSYSPHHQSLSEEYVVTGVQNATKYSDTLDSKLETNRVRRQITSRTEINDTSWNNTGHYNGGYALRYRPMDVVLANSNVNSSANDIDDLYNQYIVESNVSNPTQFPSSPQPQLAPTHRPNRFSSQLYGTLPSRNRNRFLVNPAESGSAHTNRYTKVEEKPFVATDFSVINVAPNSQPARPRHPVMYEQHASYHRPQVYPYSPGAISTNNFHSPHYFDRQYMHPYYGAAGPPPPPPLLPRFYPPIYLPYANNYHPPDTSIVTLNYPKPEASPQQGGESPSSSSVNEQTTTPMTTTVKPLTNETKNNTILDEGESVRSNTKKNKNKSKDEFENDEEEDEKDEEEQHTPEEAEDEDPPEEDFANDELNTPSASYRNETNVRKSQQHQGDDESNEEEGASNDPEENEHQPTEHDEEDEESTANENEADVDERIPDINTDHMESELELMFDGDKDVEDRVNEKFAPSSLNITKEIRRNVGTKFPVSFSSFYRRYINDERESPFSNPDFDLLASQSVLVKPVTVLPPAKLPKQNTTAHTNTTASRVKKANYGYYEKVPPTGTYAKIFPAVHHAKISSPQPTPINVPQPKMLPVSVPQVSNLSPAATNQTGISRKNDEVLTLQIYDHVPQVLLKTTRATKPKPMMPSSKRVIPLALLHTYKPANHSYINHQHRYRLQPTTVYNAYEEGHKSLPVNQLNNIGKTSYFPSYHSFGSYFPSYQFSSPKFNFPNSSTDAPVDEEECQGEECNEEEETTEEAQPEEGDTSSNNEGSSSPDDGGNNNEYYDDYSNDYANDDHLEHPYTPPRIPSRPSQIRNIDFEVTSPPVDFDDDKDKENQENEEESNDEQEEDPEAENEEEEEDEQDDDGKNDKEEQQEDEEESDEAKQDDQPEEKESSSAASDNNESVETSPVLRKLRNPPKQGASVVNQIMNRHRQNKYQENASATDTKDSPNARITIAPPSTSSNVPRKTIAALRNGTTSTVKPDIRGKPKSLSNKTKATTVLQTYSYAVPTASASASQQTLSYLDNPTLSSSKSLNYDYKSKNSKFTEEERNKNTNTETNPKRTRPTKSTTTGTTKWPSSSLPSYIIEQTSSSIPTTAKAIYNVTKFEPYYSVYDEDAQVYSDIEYGQYQNQRKLPNTYQVIQKSQHRLQPQQAQVINDVPSYTNTDYRLQSNIDADTQQTEKLPSTRLFLDNSHHSDVLTKPSGNEKPVEFFVSSPNTRINLPAAVVGHATLQNNRPSHNNYNNNRNSNNDNNNNNGHRHLKITSFFNLANDTYQRPTEKSTKITATRPASFETVKSYELTLIDHEDVITGETLQLPKVTPYYFIRKFSPNTSSTVPTTNFVKSTTSTSTTTTFRPATTKLTKASHLVGPGAAANNENFRIIVEPIAVYKKLMTVTGTPTTTPKTTPALTSLKAFTNALLLSDKFSSASHYRSQPFSNFTYIPYTTITTSTTTKPTTVSSSVASDNSDKLNRRFYIPRTDTGTLERKLQFSSVTSTNSPPSIPVPKIDKSFRTTKKVLSTTSKYTEDEEDEEEEEDSENDQDDTPRNSKAVTAGSLANIRNRGKVGNDTIKLYEDNEILYYDDYYDEVENEKNDNQHNNDNYIDNKISEYTTHKSTKPLIGLKSNSIPTKTATASTAVHHHNVPSKSSFFQKVPFEESTTTGVSKEADIGTNKRFKESSTQRCPQCNEKPLVRGRNRGSITYTTGGNEYDSVTSAGGRTRPTLKPSTSIVSKTFEGADIYKNFPKRPDPVYPTPQVDKPAAKCRKDICLLPDCSCGGKDIPGDLPLEDVPQIVLLTFDDSVNELNKGLYADLFEKGRINPNGCPISATFYVSHEWTDYSMVQNLYAVGHEIASHSVSHSFGEQFSQRKWTKEIVGQREILSAYGGVRQDDIRGMRAPFLAVGGNKMFKMLYDSNFTYDSSMPIYENRPPSWPYTLDYKLFHDCMIPPCPTRSYPGVWEVPMVMWQDLNGGRCSMGDACSNPSNADGVYKMLIKNFERHFTTNRAPFGLFYHSSWFTQPHHKEGFMTFLDTIMNMPEVWLVTNWQAIQWARDPTPTSRLNQFTPFGCDFPERPKRCNNPKVCNLWHKSGVRYLKTCQPCPDVYPWTGKTGVRNSRVDNDDTLTE